VKSEFIKQAHSETEFTAEQVQELKKCAEDPVYFINNYCYIQHQKLGKIKFTLRPYQVKIVRALQHNRWCILLQPRQTGKCFYKQTLINISAKQSGENAKLIKVEDLSNTEPCEILGHNDILKFIGKQELSDTFIETPTGFSKVKRLLKTVKYKEYKITLADGKELICADDHLLIQPNGTPKHAIEFKIDDQVQVLGGSSTIISIEDLQQSSEMYDIELEDDNHVFYTNGILSHNTEITSAFAYWFACFQSDKNVLVASNKQKGATVIMNRIKFMYESTPDFLRPGVKYYNRGSIEFDNNSTIWSEATTEDTGRGKTVGFFISDETAHIKKNIQEEMWSSIFPTLSTGGSCVVMSTPNGDHELFAELWRGAMSNTNGFVPIQVFNHEVPDRDAAWEEMMKNKLGELRFRQEFGCEFLSDDPLLIKSLTLQGLREANPIFIDKGFSFWKEIDPNNTYIVGADVAEGVNQDFSTIQVLELETMEQVAEFRNNTINESQLYNAIKYIITKILSYRDQRTGRFPTIYWSFENNSAGAAIGTLYFNDDKFPDEATLLSSNGERAGFRTVNKPKLEACRHLKNLTEKSNGNLKIHSRLLIFELKNYIAKGASYAAKHGATDDLISAMLIIMRMIKQLSEYEPEIFQSLYSTEEDFHDETSNDFDEPMPFIM